MWRRSSLTHKLTHRGRCCWIWILKRKRKKTKNKIYLSLFKCLHRCVATTAFVNVHLFDCRSCLCLLQTINFGCFSPRLIQDWLSVWQQLALSANQINYYFHSTIHSTYQTPRDRAWNLNDFAGFKIRQKQNRVTTTKISYNIQHCHSAECQVPTKSSEHFCKREICISVARVRIANRDYLTYSIVQLNAIPNVSHYA